MTNILFAINLVVIFFISFTYIDIAYKLYHYDSYIHFFMYFILGLLVSIGSKRSFIIKFLIVFLIPIITEYMQNFIKMRRPDPVDLFYDYLGLFVGIITILVFRYVNKT